MSKKGDYNKGFLAGQTSARNEATQAENERLKTQLAAPPPPPPPPPPAAPPAPQRPATPMLDQLKALEGRHPLQVSAFMFRNSETLKAEADALRAGGWAK